MISISTHHDVPTAGVDLLPRVLPRDHYGVETEEKWPLWWTVLGVGSFCSLFWAGVLSLIF